HGDGREGLPDRDDRFDEAAELGTGRPRHEDAGRDAKEDGGAARRADEDEMRGDEIEEAGLLVERLIEPREEGGKERLQRRHEQHEGEEGERRPEEGIAPEPPLRAAGSRDHGRARSTRWMAPAGRPSSSATASRSVPRDTICDRAWRRLAV